MQDFYNRKIMKACGLTSLPDRRTFDIRLSTLENRYIQIHPSFDKLITSLRSAWAKDVVPDNRMITVPYDGRGCDEPNIEGQSTSESILNSRKGRI